MERKSPLRLIAPPMMTGTNQNRSSFFSTVYSFLARLFSRSEPGKVDYTRPHSTPDRDQINERIRVLREEFKDLELERQALDNISSDTSFLSIVLPEETESAPLARFEGIPITEVPSMMRLKDDLLRRHEIRLKKVEAQALDLIKVIRGLISDGLLSDAREVFDNLNQVIVEVESKDIREAFKETILFWNNERHKIESERIKAEAQKKRLERESIILSEPVQTEANEDKAVIDRQDTDKQNKYDALLDRIRKNQAAIEPIRTALSRVNTNKSKHHRGIESQLKRMGTLFLYHYTDQRNLASINKYGGLLSYKFMIEHGIDIPVPLGDDTSHNIDKDLHMDDYIKLLPIIDHDAITALKQEHKIVILQIDTAVACMQDSRFAPQSLFSDECLISDDYRVIKSGANQVMILAKTFIPKKYIIDVVDC